jgi:trehalose synthase
LQLQDGAGGFLVDSVEECAERVLWLLLHAIEADELAVRGRDLVRKRFLLTRLIADELRLYASLLGTRQPAQLPVALIGLACEDRGPVCGMRLDPRKAPTLEYAGVRLPFCSQACRDQFARSPERFLRSQAGVA